MKWLSNFSIKDLFYNRKFAVSFSVVVAFIFWLIITIDQNPEREQTFNNIPVSVSVAGTVLEDLGIDVISNEQEIKASVRVNGPSYIVSGLKSEDIVVTASISHIVRPGTYVIDLVATKNSNKSGYNFISVSPSTVTLSFDYIDTKQFPVIAQAEGVSAVKGLIAENPIASSNEDSTITVKGPRTTINKISKVLANVSETVVLDATKSFSGNIQLYDAYHNLIDTTGLTLSKDKVNVSVPIFKKANVSIIPVISNAPSNALSFLQYTLDCDSTVAIKGPPDTINTLQSVTLSAININDISLKNYRFNVNPILPDGVKFVENIDSVNVSFDMSKYVEKTITVSNIKALDLPYGLNASCSSIKNVKVCVPKSKASSVTSADFTATIDLTGKNAGEYSVASTISTDLDGVWVIGTYNVSVDIK